MRADICIVGGGAVGIAMALALAGKGRDVLLVEAGGTVREDAIQKAYRGTVVDPALHSPLIDYRERRLGGTTTIWGGRCMPLDPIDFTRRAWIPASGWPIDADTLAPYYPAANRLCEAGAFDYRADSALRAGARAMIGGFAGTAYTTDRLERFSCPTDFGTRYRERLAAARDVRVVLKAAVQAIGLDPAGQRVATLTLRDPAGRTFTVTAGDVVLGAGGLETTRLLLASRDVHPHGIGNHHDVLGRYYMSHLAGTIGTVHFADPDRVWHGYDVAEDGTYCRRRLALGEDAQRDHRIGNFVARLHHPRIADPGHRTGVLSALFLGRMLVPRLYRQRLAGSGGNGLRDTVEHAINVARQPSAVARFAWQALVDRRLAERKFPSIVVVPRSGRYSLDFHAEQEPQHASRVYLGTERDAWGMPRLVADWRYSAGDVTTVKTALALLAEDLARGGCGRFDYDPDEVEREMTRYGAYPGHHIGLVRMGDDPRHSMVDPDCRIHGIANLYIAGAAVFPTSSQANPTLTAVALALRLADRLLAKPCREAGAVT
nr:GMC family oxidoreductase [Sphingomonas insulae]